IVGECEQVLAGEIEPEARNIQPAHQIVAESITESQVFDPEVRSVLNEPRGDAFVRRCSHRIGGCPWDICYITGLLPSAFDISYLVVSALKRFQKQARSVENIITV